MFFVCLSIVLLLALIILYLSYRKQKQRIVSYDKQIIELNSIFAGLNSPVGKVNDIAKEKFFSKNSLSMFSCSTFSASLHSARDYVNSLINNYEAEISKRDTFIHEMELSLKNLLDDHIKSFPYISGMIADYILLDEYASNVYHGRSVIKNERKLRIDVLLKEKKELIQRSKELQYQLDFLLTAFPALSDFLSTDYRDIKFSFDYKDYDPVRDYLSKAEYLELSDSEKNQLALDRYIESHKKSKWQIGRDYELSVGYQYEKKGYNIEYFGESEGLADLGRDLIARKGKRVLIIQCKYWSAEKTIREKHIAQLFGTSICYQVDHPELDVVPLFIASTNLSDEAKSFANKLHVTYVENFPFKEFPRIKCNIGRDEFGNSLIYHLPMDQQYDSVKINKAGECMVFTVKEAEEKGFRRAYKWHNS